MEFVLQYPLLLILATATPDFDFLTFHFFGRGGVGSGVTLGCLLQSVLFSFFLSHTMLTSFDKF